MSYIGYPQPPRALTSADIDEGAVTLADISFTDTPSNLNLNGNYNDQTMRLAHNTTVTGDVTLNNSKDFTVSSSSGLLVSSASHNLSNDDQIYVQTSATLPTGLSINTNYYVISKTDDTFKLSTTRGGSAIAYTNAGSGTHTWYKNVNLILAKVADDGNPVTLTNDGGTRTLSGIGSIETSTLSSRPNSLVTGMTGVLDNTVQDNITRLGTVTSGTIGSGVTNNAGVSSGVINNAVSGFTGIKNAFIWRAGGSDVSGDQAPYTQLASCSTPSGVGSIGTDMSHSSGTFTFPATGIWFILANWIFIQSSTGEERGSSIAIHTTTDNSTYVSASWAGESIHSQAGTSYANPSCFYIFDVSNTTTHKVQFHIDTVNTDTKSQTGTDQNRSCVLFARIGDT